MASLASNRRVVLVWMGLVIATLLSWTLGSADAFFNVANQRFTVASVIVVAFVKVRFVGVHFMDLRSAPWGLRLAFDIWVLSVGSVVLYLAAGYQAI